MKKTMKWLLLFGGILAFGIICVLVYVLSMGTDRVIKHDGYDLIKKDGRCYISLHEKREEERVYSDINIVCIPFSSLSDMKKRIQEGKLSQEELRNIRDYLSVNGVWEICDLENLYDVRVPDGVTTGRVVLCGLSYTIGFKGKDSSTGYIAYYEESRYKERYREYFLDFPSGGGVKITGEETAEDRNATIINYETTAGIFKAVKYTVMQEGRTLHVIEQYRLFWFRHDQSGTSEICPFYVKIFEEKNGVYSEIDLRHLTGRPTVEWLVSFEPVPPNWFQRMFDF